MSVIFLITVAIKPELVFCWVALIVDVYLVYMTFREFSVWWSSGDELSKW